MSFAEILNHSFSISKMYPSLRLVCCIAIGIGFSLRGLSRPVASPSFTVACIAIPIIFSFQFSNEFSSDTFMNKVFACSTVIYLAHISFIFFLLPTQSVNEGRAQNGGKNINRTFDLPDWTYALKSIFNFRGVGTHWQVRSRPVSAGPFQLPSNGSIARNHKNPKRTFVIRQSMILLYRCTFLSLYFDPSIHPRLFGIGQYTIHDFSQEKEIFFRNLMFQTWSVTGHDVGVRVRFILDQMIPTYMILSSFHDMLAIISVGTGLDTPEEWPPLFGSICHAYTLRGYWSCFWHQLINRSFSAHASLFSKSILRIPQRSLMSRYVNNALVFVFSGLMHSLVEWHVDPGSPCGYWGAAIVFSIQFFGIGVEEAVQRVSRQVERRLPLKYQKSVFLRWGKRTVGYLWVFWFRFTIQPKTSYPKVRCTTKRHLKLSWIERGGGIVLAIRDAYSSLKA